jgi:hypothetical protein
VNLLARSALVFFVAGALAFQNACIHAPSSVTTPAGKTAYTADQIVQRVNELQNAAIQAQQTGGLSEPTTAIIVRFCVSAAQTLKATPAGWQQTVLTAWTTAKSQLPAKNVSNPAIQAAIAGVDVVLAAFQGGN